MKKTEVPATLASPVRECCPAAVQAALESLLAGKSTNEINNEISTQFPAEDPEAVMLAATDEIMQAAEMPPEAVAGWCILTSREIYRKSLEAKNLTVALAAVKAIYTMRR